MKVGDKLRCWFRGPGPDEMSTITRIEPYRGKYKEFFTHDVTLTSCTPNGTISMSVDQATFDWEHAL